MTPVEQALAQLVAIAECYERECAGDPDAHSDFMARLVEIEDEYKRARQARRGV